VALLLLGATMPFMLLLILVVRTTSRGPGIYKQVRVGLNGRTFTMYKIRTMRHDVEAATGPVWAAINDPRLTGAGRIIRALHLDELPQLWNVVRGEMSLVGPRPERPEFTRILGREIPGYFDRLLVRPGITGLAQINLPPDTDLNSVRRKLILDLEYICEANAWLDVRIICWTAFRAMGIRWYSSTRLFKLHRPVTLPSGMNRLFDEEQTSQPVPIAELIHLNGQSTRNGRVHHKNGHASAARVERPVRPR
jgi:lipopolysaccharide/colanic/teichoic acid biosynthesis glycosyltransferase